MILCCLTKKGKNVNEFFQNINFSFLAFFFFFLFKPIEYCYGLEALKYFRIYFSQEILHITNTSRKW